ncbi:hypothetical protein E1B28_003187 [Marasmius oreades]|uniref:non-specific serine/threonine protein kinase n=1 Tax=Marasmius oreades TaxID=181124 RepID=A0A9P7UKF5_9AGAR|nr:uncharacterized protein E1B28_003187 [Marasmius oreades]KAG7085640.1 hypothetical protein E1B28_003187 [Marasmius oreades]
MFETSINDSGQLFFVNVPVENRLDSAALFTRLNDENLLKNREPLIRIASLQDLFEESSPNNKNVHFIYIPPKLPSGGRKRPNPVSVSDIPPERDLKKMRAYSDTPSLLATPSRYQAAQCIPTARLIYDDRPGPDYGVAPIALLYPPYGDFLDACAKPLPKEFEAIDLIAMMREVDALVVIAAGFHKDEDERNNQFIDALNRIFQCYHDRSEPLAPMSRAIIAQKRTTDGHTSGPITDRALEVKCSTGNATSNGEVQIALYVHNINASAQERCPKLFERYRVPTLAMTLIGEKRFHPTITLCQYVVCFGGPGPSLQFFGMVQLNKMPRQVALTPSFRLVQCPGDGGGYACGRVDSPLYRAFAAALVLCKRITKDMKDWMNAADSDTNAPIIPIQNYTLPAISQIGDVRFQIESKLGLDHGPSYVYLARTEQGRDVVVKFSEQYCQVLHNFCAEKGMAPKLLGYENLPGGWIGVVMGYLPDSHPLADPRFTSEEKQKMCDKLKACARAMHDNGYVHGDLRETNVIGVKEGTVWIIDFDWGGEDGKAEYPHASLNEHLLDKDQKDLVIRRAHDERVLRTTIARILGS